MTLKIRVRTVRYRGPETFGSRVSVEEYQVWDGRRIVSRHELRSHAEAWIEKQIRPQEPPT